MNMMYAMYIKDIKMQGYKDMMDIWVHMDVVMAMSCATPGR